MTKRTYIQPVANIDYSLPQSLIKSKGWNFVIGKRPLPEIYYEGDIPQEILIQGFNIFEINYTKTFEYNNPDAMKIINDLDITNEKFFDIMFDYIIAMEKDQQQQSHFSTLFIDEEYDHMKNYALEKWKKDDILKDLENVTIPKMLRSIMSLSLNEFIETCNKLNYSRLFRNQF
ncbi:MAG: hypothetical protein ACXAC7_21850 [Candidatus Hodarchaeales archaeon]|jgi:hypothetical protein